MPSVQLDMQAHVGRLLDSAVAARPFECRRTVPLTWSGRSVRGMLISGSPGTAERGPSTSGCAERSPRV